MTSPRTPGGRYPGLVPCPTYGIVSAYTNHGCRCDTCKANNATYVRGGRPTTRQNVRGGRYPGLVPCPTYGIVSAHSTRGCRCDTCRSNARIYARGSANDQTEVRDAFGALRRIGTMGA